MQVDLKNVDIDSNDPEYWKAVAFELYELRHKEKQAIRDQYLVQQKIEQDLADEQEQAQVLRQKELEEKRKVAIAQQQKEPKEVFPQVEYDPYKQYNVKLHQPELHIIYELLDEKISNFTMKTSYGSMCKRMRKKFKKRMIGSTYSTEPFDRRIPVVTPINSISKPELLGEKNFAVNMHPSLELYKLACRNRHIELAWKKRMKDKEKAEHEAYKLKIQAERAKNGELLQRESNVELTEDEDETLPLGYTG